MKFIIGVGNPGKTYVKTRHNVGFNAVHALSARLKADSSPRWKKREELKAEVCSAEDALLIKPSTFVNNTSQTVLAIVQKYHPTAKDFLVICDDVNLTFGKLRLRESGSAGGHHGLESIIGALGSEEFSRLRIGVGNDKMPQDLVKFVLEKFSREEEKEINKILEKVVSICESWMKEGSRAALNRLSQLQSMNKESLE